MIDLWRNLNPGVRDYTYFSHRHQSLSRIDFLLASEDLQQNFIDSDIGLRLWSDHACVEAQFYFKNAMLHTRRWRFNQNLLYIEPMHTELESELNSYFELNADCGVSSSMVWDAMKAVIRGKVIAITTAYKKQKKKYKDDLLQKISKLEKLRKKTCSPKIFKALTIERKNLEALEIHKIEKNLLYLKQNYWLRSPKATKLLAWKVRTRASQNQVHEFKDKKGKKHTLTSDILSVFEKYYASLYSSSSPNAEAIKEYLRTSIPNKQLTEEHIDLLEAPVTPEEVQAVIQRLKNNKSPGEDSYTAEFYKMYASILANPLASTFNDILMGGQLPPSWNVAEIAVIPKKDRDILDTKSYCPISLLNQDYKIFTSILTKRLNKIIGCYIGQDQTGFIPGRDIMDNIYRTIEIIHCCRKQHLNSTAILSLDVEKAFDRVEIPYLLTLLEHMAFGPKFITALQAIYKDPIARVRVNGATSHTFKIERGTRQGCPLSPLLFTLAIEPLTETLRSSPDYKGIHTGNQHHKINLFADDMALFMIDPEISLPQIENILTVYQQVSGLQVNKDKSCIYPIQMDNQQKILLQQKFPYIWIKDTWKYLGVRFLLDFAQFSKQNLERIDAEVKKLLTTWNDKMLNWFEQINLVKMMIFPKYLFLF